MKIFYFMPLLLVGCMQTGTYNNKQVKTQCAIGYHQEYSVNRVLYNSEDKDTTDKPKSKITKKFRCMPDSENDKLLHPENY